MPSNGSSDEIFPDNVPACHRIIADLRKKLEATEEKLKEQETLFRRMAADFENYRRRLEK